MSSRTINHSGQDEFRKPPEHETRSRCVPLLVDTDSVQITITESSETGSRDDTESLREVSSDGE